MRKGRLPKESSKKGQSEDVEGRVSCRCGNRNFFSHVCRQCQELICKNCRTGEHKHHESDKISVVAGELRNDIRESVSKQTKSDASDSVQKGKEVIVKMRKELFTIERTEVDKINKHVKELHHELDEIRMDLVKRVNIIVRKDIQYLQVAEEDLDKTAQYIELMHDAAKSMLEKANDIEIIKGGYSIFSLLNDILKTKVTMPIKGQTFSMQFVAGKCNRYSLHNMFGEIAVQSGNKQALRQRQPPISAQSANDQADTQTPKHSQPTISAQSANDQADTQTPKHSQPTIAVQSGNKQALKQRQPPISAPSENDQAKIQTTKQPTTLVPGPSAIGTTSGMAAKTMTCVSCFSVSGADVVIRRICATADDKCWYSDFDSADIKLVDMTGTRHKPVTVGVECSGITTADDSSLFVTCIDRSIRKISANHKVTKLQSSLSFFPQGLSVVPVTGELLVCGWDDGMFSVTKRGVQKTLTDIKFEDAHDIAINNNGDICVTDRNKVFILNSNKRHVGTYEGLGTSIQNKMYPCGVTSHSRGEFIIADCNNHALHVINCDGDVLIYDTTQDCKEQPYYVDISQSGRLWVSFGFNKICVYEMI